MTGPFESFNQGFAAYSATFRAEVAAHGADGEWRLLALECRDAVDHKNDYDPVLD